MNSRFDTFLRDNSQPCFLPDWTPAEDAKAELVVVDFTGFKPRLQVIWHYKFADKHALGRFWEFIVGLQGTWPFMCCMVEKQGPEALTAMLRRHGAPLPQQ